MQLAPDVGVGGTGARIDARHASVADGGEDHRDHRDEHSGDDVPLTCVGERAVSGHGRSGLDDDDAVENEVPKAESALQTGGGCAAYCRSRHCLSLKSQVSSFKYPG